LVDKTDENWVDRWVWSWVRLRALLKADNLDESLAEQLAGNWVEKLEFESVVVWVD
jgi:hypothetical protein